MAAPDEKKVDEKATPIDGEFREVKEAMNPERQLAVREAREVAIGLVQDPTVVVEQARKAATALTAVIASKKKKVEFNGETYLESEDWVLIGEFYGAVAKIRQDRPIEREVTDFDTGTGERAGSHIARGWEAEAVLLDKRTGEEIGSAPAECLDDEENWGARPKYEWVDAGKIPAGATVVKTVDGKWGKRAQLQVGFDAVPDFQRRSMAQTRAASRALALRFKFVPVLAGYAGTPAEEMKGVRANRTGPTEPSGAPEHDDALPPKDAKPAAPAAPAVLPMSDKDHSDIAAAFRWYQETSIKGTDPAKGLAGKVIVEWGKWMQTNGTGAKWEKNDRGTGLWPRGDLVAKARELLGIAHLDPPTAAPAEAPKPGFDPDEIPA